MQNFDVKRALPDAVTKGVKSGCRMGLMALGVMIVLGLPGQAEAQSYSFNSVSVEGNQRVDGATILSYAGLVRGEVVSDADLNDAYQRVLDSGLFETVTIEPQGNRLVIRVEEFPTINKIAFEGNQRLKDEDLEGFIESQSRQVFSPAKAERDAAILTEAYEQNGRIAARITPKVIRRSDNRVDLIFEIFEGGNIEVQRIGFVGNRKFSDRRLRGVIGSKQAGLLRAIIQRDSFVEDRLQFDRQVLTDFYQSRGYVDFRVMSVNAELARERDAYFVTFNVKEGQQFKFGEITTVSDLPNVDAEAYKEALKIRPGVVYSPTLVETSVARLERLGIKQGIDFLRVEPRITRNDRDLTLDVEFALVRGPRVFVERIDIEGNTTTLDRVIRRQFDVVEGDPFNPRQVREAAERIRALGFFGNADVNAREGARPDQVVVDVDVEETTTGSLSFGGSFSTDTGFGVQIGFSERNFMGRGQALTAQVSLGGDTANYVLDFTEPAFLGRDVTFGFRTSYRETDTNNTNLYDTVYGDLRPSLSFPISENGRLGLYYSLNYGEMKDYIGDFEGILANEVALGGLYSSSLGYDYTYDTRRTGLNPNAGVLFSFGQEFAGIGGDVEFIRTSARILGQTKVLNEELTLRASLEGGLLEYGGSDTSRAIDRYNSKIMRGFEPGGIGPKEGDEFLGGNYFAVAKFEADFPLGLPEEYGISGGAFYDIGAIWDVDSTNAVETLSSTGFEDRQAIGVSVFWQSPFGPLRMNFSQVIKEEPGDRDQLFDLTVRTDF